MSALGQQLSGQGAPLDAEKLRSILDLQRRLTGCVDLNSLIATLADGVASLLPVSDRISLAFLDPGGESLRVYRVLPAAELTAARLPRVRVEGTVIGQVVREGVGRVVADVRTDPNLTFGHASHDGIRSTASVPVFVAGRVVGAMNIGSRVVGACDPRMLGELAQVAASVGSAVFAAEQIFALDAPEGTVSHERPAGLIGQSAVFRSLLATARRAAASDATVLLTGETGVGKTALARALHDWSPRATGPFVPVHVADLPSTLVESELFGHERGAFTGAAARRLGRFELAEGGTLFLDEIGEVPLATQSKLLRVLHDGCFERVGGATVKANVRVIAATNRDLEQSVERGEFREDLFYRLNVLPLQLPPLRERPEDLEPLALAILARLTSEDRPALHIAPEAWARLRAHRWPGNVRELESLLQRAVVLETGATLRLEGFPGRSGHPAGRALGPRARQDWPSRDENERRYLAEVLERAGGVIEGALGAARILGMRPSTLRSRMSRLGISAAVVRRAGRRP